MGNQNNSKFEWQKNFMILERNFNDSTLVVQKRDGGKEFLARQIISTDKKQSQYIKRLIKLKYHNNNLFLTKLAEVYYSNDEGYCSPEDKIYLIFFKPKQTLRQQILSRKFSYQKFSEDEADIILQSGAKAIRALKEMKHPHNNISSSSIFIDENRRVLLGDPWITPPVYGHDMNQNVFTCPSPQKILLQNDQIMSICQYRSDLFSLGTVVLEALNFEHMDILYEKGFRKVLQSKIKQKLDKIKNEQLRYKLSIVLSHDPQNRDQIYNLYKGSGQTIQNKTIKNITYKQQTNFKNIDLQNKISPINVLSNQITRNYSKNHPQIIQQQYPTQNYVNFQQNNKIQFQIPASRIPKVQFYKNNIVKPGYSQFNNNLPYPKPINNIPYMRPTFNYQTNLHPQPHNLTNVTNNQNFSYSQNFNRQINVPTYTPMNIINYPTKQFSQGSYIKQMNLNTNMREVLENKQVYTVAENKNFEPIMIKSTDENVKTSSNIRYSENQNHEGNSLQQQTSSHILTSDKLQHISNYVIKSSNSGLNSKQQSYEIPKQQELEQSKINRRTASEGSDKVFIETLNQTQPQNQLKIVIKQSKETPQRRPTRKYNSTIKEQPDEYQNSNQRDISEDLSYVIEEYQAGRYQGQKKNGMRNGFGKFYYNEGSVYQGTWKDNLMNGKGNLYYCNGKLAYQGEWRMDQFHGIGKVYNQDQLNINGYYDYSDFSNVNDYWSVYEGELNSDRRHGKGKIKLSNGQIFVGNFVTDSVEGEGKFYTLNGDIIHGFWRNNKLIRRL